MVLATFEKSKPRPKSPHMKRDSKSPQSSKESPGKYKNLSPAEVVKESAPYNMLFTKVSGIDDKYNRNAVNMQGKYPTISIGKQ